MSKERLEEIVEKITEQTYDRLIVPKTKIVIDYQDITYLTNTIIEQAERVGILLEQTGHNFEVNRKLDAQNKRLEKQVDMYKARLDTIVTFITTESKFDDYRLEEIEK